MSNFSWNDFLSDLRHPFEASHLVDEALVSDGSCKSRQAFPHHGSRPFEGYEAGAHGSKSGSCSWLSLQTSCCQPTRQAGFGIPEPTQDNLRTRLFLASARAMSIRNTPKTRLGLLAREVLHKRSARPPYAAGIEEIGLEYPNCLAVRIEEPAKIGSANRGVSCGLRTRAEDGLSV